MFDDFSIDDFLYPVVPVTFKPCPICGGYGDYFEHLYPDTLYSRGYWRPCPPPDDPVMPGCGGQDTIEIVEKII